MKKTAVLITLALTAVLANAQKVIEKNIDHKGQFIEMNMPFASEIKVKTWDKSNIYLKATLSSKEPELLEYYHLKIDEGASHISIASDTEAFFKAYRAKRKKANKKYWHQEYKFNYVLYVPQKAPLKIKSINGSLVSEEINGDFEADLINGDIEIERYTGNLRLKTINGEIDLSIGKNRFVAETIHGDIYADEQLKIKSHNRHVGQKVESLAANGSSRIKLNTINGNMYLRL